MNKYDFNKIINRRNTNSVKYDFAKEFNKPEDVMPMWVADMDFEVFDEVRHALQEVSQNQILGYTKAKDDYYEAVQTWFNNNFNYMPKKEWFVKTPGVVVAMANAIKAFTKEGDSILIQKPVYHPFELTILKNNRKVIDNTLIYEDNYYCIDFNDFEEKIKHNNVRLFILCSPHNPIMRVWTKDELYKMGQICRKYGVIVFSDEIHQDIVYNNYKHTIFSNSDESFNDFCVISTSPAKTFNLAGLQIANNFIPNQKLRKLFSDELYKSGYHQSGIMGLTACKKAYECGYTWHKHLIQYLHSNIQTVQNFLKTKVPQVIMPEPQATYLLWLNFLNLGINHRELENIILNNAKVWLHNGITFGKTGAGFMRINIACPNSVLTTSLENIAKSIN